MKKYLHSVILLVIMACASDDNPTVNNDPAPATTAITDTNFEQALIDLGYDNVIDGSVLTSSIELITDLIIDNKEISNLTGLQDFVNLSNLSANGNSIANVNVSANTKLKFIFLDENNLSSINVQNLPELEKVSVSNNNITTINVSDITTLQLLILDGNEISQLNVATNTSLNTLDTRNNNINCIEVSNNQLANTPSGWVIDNTTIYNTNCN